MMGIQMIGGVAAPNPGGAAGQPAINPAVGAILQTYRHEVLTRADWQDATPWVPAPYLSAIAANDTVYPSHSTATFRYEYGAIDREDRAAFVNFPPLLGRDLFVCINILPELHDSYPIWCGIIPSEELRVFGTDGVVPSGDQTLRAYGLSYLLDRRTPMLSFVEDDTESPLTAFRLRRLVGFNERRTQGRRTLGNRSEDTITFDDGGGPDSVAFGFGDEADSSGDRFLWTHGDILEYLLWMSGLRDGQESNDVITAEPQFILGGRNEVIDYLDTLVSVIRQDGASVWATIGKVIDRKRGLLMRVVWDVGADGLPAGTINLEIDTLIDHPIVIGDVTLPANLTGRDLDIDTGLEITDASITVDEVKEYEFIVVEGARTISCFTMTGGTFPVTGTLPIFERGWSAGRESIYVASDETGRKGAILSRIFRVYRLPLDFDWIMPLPEPLPDPLPQHVYLNPHYRFDGEFNGGATFWNSNRSFLRELPIVDPADDPTQTNDARFLRTLAFVWSITSPGVSSFFPAHDIPITAVSGASNARITNVPNELSVDVRFSPPEHLAGFTFGDEAAPELPPEFPDAPFDHRNMLITVAVETDMAPRVTIRLAGFAGRGRQLRIQVPDVEVWMVANNTAIGTVFNEFLGGNLILYHNDGEGSVVRDDRERLRGVAALARAWYGEPRSLLRAVMPGLLDAWRPGTFVRAVGTFLGWQIIASPITERSWDFEAGTTMIRTGSMELDVRAVR